MRPSLKLPLSIIVGFLLSLLAYQSFFEKKCVSRSAVFSTNCAFLEVTLIPSLTVVIAIVIYLLIPKNE